MRKYEMLGRYQVERLVKKELTIIDSNSTGNYVVYGDYENYKYCFSYDTLIAILRPNKIPLFTWVANGYSITTSKHTHKFMFENGGVYYSSLFSAKWLKKMIKEDNGYEFEYEIANIDELRKCLEIND